MVRKKDINSKIPTRVIGVMGTTHGAGATHFCCMLGVFLTIVKGYRIAIVEVNNSACFRQAEIILNNLKNNKSKKILKMISIYKEADELKLSEVVSMDFDFVIVDYGSDYDITRGSFLMCQRKFVIGSMAWWKLQSYVTFLVNTENEQSRKHWIFLTTTPVSEGIGYVKKEFKIQVTDVPYEPDPFRLGKNSIEFFYKLADREFGI